VGVLFIATTIAQLFSLFSARARGRFHAHDGHYRARAENKKMITLPGGFYTQVTHYVGLY
jgi:hypothetical protein